MGVGSTPNAILSPDGAAILRFGYMLECNVLTVWVMDVSNDIFEPTSPDDLTRENARCAANRRSSPKRPRILAAQRKK